jgi:plasmid stabilization system protein ParE
MACKIIWSPASRDDLRDIVRFIARDNPQRAESFGYELMRRTDILQQHPEAGRVVPEYRNPKLREIIYRPYRIVYRLNIDRKLIEIAPSMARSTRDSAGLNPTFHRDTNVPPTFPQNKSALPVFQQGALN